MRSPSSFSGNIVRNRTNVEYTPYTKRLRRCFYGVMSYLNILILVRRHIPPPLPTAAAVGICDAEVGMIDQDLEAEEIEGVVDRIKLMRAAQEAVEDSERRRQR